MAEAKKKLARPISVIEEELRNDPATKSIAETLGMELDDYINTVLDYCKNPEKDPQLYVYDDAELERYEGEAPATGAEIMGFLKKLDSGEIPLGPTDNSVQTAFDDEEETATQRKARSVTGAATAAKGPRADPGAALRGQMGLDKGPARGVKRGIAKKKSDDSAE